MQFFVNPCYGVIPEILNWLTTKKHDNQESYKAYVGMIGRMQKYLDRSFTRKWRTLNP